MKKLLLTLLLSLGLIGITSAEEKLSFSDKDVQTNTLRLEATNACVGCMLKGVNLSGIDLSYANLRRANLFGANLSGANLFRANLSGANLSYANLNRANLLDANLLDANLNGANLKGAKVGNQKAEEEKRITDEKKAEEKAEEKRIADIKKEKESEQRILSLKDYPGFKDLKPGLHYEDLTEFCDLRRVYWVKCYGIDNIKFRGQFSNDVLNELILDMGPIVEGGGFHLNIFGDGDSNIFIKMKKTFDKKYTLDYGYSERDRQLFNESEKSKLLLVYSKGQVVLEINRKEKDYSNDLWLYIHYLNSFRAKSFLESNRPMRASEDDF